MMVSKTIILFLPIFLGYVFGDLLSGILFGCIVFFLMNYNGSFEYLGWEYWEP